MSRLAAYRDAFDNWSLLAKVAGDYGYVPDFSTDGGEFTRVIHGKRYTTLRVLGHGERVLAAHPLWGDWRRDRVMLIAEDGGERNLEFVPDVLTTRPMVRYVVDLPDGEWGLVYDAERDSVRLWGWRAMKRRGLSFLIGGGDVARREGLAVWSNMDGLTMGFASCLHLCGWWGTEFYNL